MREAALEDEGGVTACLQELADMSEFTQFQPADTNAVRESAASLMRNKDVIVVIAERDDRIVGACLLCLFRNLWSGLSQAGEVCWWVTPRERRDWLGVRLVRHAVDVAVERGARVVEMIAPKPQYVKVLKRLGFTEHGVILRRVSCQSR